MPDPRDPLAGLTPMERERLKALADKRDQAVDTVSAVVDKADRSRRDVIGKI